MHLEGEEAFERGVFFIGVREVGAGFAVQPSLEMISFASNHDGVPVIPFEELLALSCEGIFDFFAGIFVRIQPAAAGFVEDSSGPTCSLLFQCHDQRFEKVIEEIKEAQEP